MRERARNIRAFLYPKPKLEAGRIEPISIPGPAGDIPARAVWPLGECSGATLVYFHGGGFILGDLDSHEAHCIRIANRTGAVVVNVGYRPAPEDTFPAGIDDAWAALRWVHGQIQRFGTDAARLAVGGDSAGGNFAAVMALLARDAGIALAAQLLIYPATDLSQEHDPTVRDFYLGTDAAAKAFDLRVSPRLAPALAGLAPAILGVGVYDFLYLDNCRYAQALGAAGVPLLVREYPTLNHGFFSCTAVSEDSRIAADQLCDDLKALLAKVPAAHAAGASASASAANASAANASATNASA